MGKEDEQFHIRGVCTCKNDLWHWELNEVEIVLTCSKCGKQAHFTVPFPMLDMVVDSNLIAWPGGQ